MPRGIPKEPKVRPETVDIPNPQEQLIAIYLAKYVCMIPGCDHKLHIADAKAIIKIINKEIQH